MLKVCKERKKEREKTKNFRAQFYPTEMSRSAGVLFFLLLFFSLFLSFSLFFSCSLSETPSPFIYVMHSPKMPDQPPFKNSWMVADLDNCVSACNKCKERVFLGWPKMLKVCKERKREKEKKLKILEHNSILLECPRLLVFFSLSLFLSFSLVRSQKYPLPTIISCTHPIIQISHLPPFKNSWNAVAINSKKGWHRVRVRNKCREGVFLREKQRKREKERKKHLRSWAFQFNRIVL